MKKFKNILIIAIIFSIIYVFSSYAIEGIELDEAIPHKNIEQNLGLDNKYNSIIQINTPLFQAQVLSYEPYFKVATYSDFSFILYNYPNNYVADNGIIPKNVLLTVDYITGIKGIHYIDENGIMHKGFKDFNNDIIDANSQTQKIQLHHLEGSYFFNEYGILVNISGLYNTEKGLCLIGFNNQGKIGTIIPYKTKEE